MSELLNNPISFHDLEYEFATAGVYAIHCKHTDTYYIGQASIVLRRLVDHFSQLREGVHQNGFMQQEFTKIGEDQFVVGLVVDMPNAPQLELLRQESAEIQRFKAHGKNLYNKVTTAIKVNPPTFTVYDTPQERKGHGEHSGYLGELGPRLSHAEKTDQENATPATCYDCGTAGLLRIDVFSCDDRFIRCRACIEKYLDNWRVVVTPRHRNIIPSPRGESYRRWLVPRDALVHEHILLAVNNFTRLYNRTPDRVFIHSDLYELNRYRDIEVVHGGIAIGRYIDIPID